MKTSTTFFALVLFAVPSLHAQIVPDGATNTLSNVTNTFTGDVTVGTNGSFTLLVLSNNSLLTNSAQGVIGRNVTARSNEVRLVSASARWHIGGSLLLGLNGAVNRLTVSNGGFVRANVGDIGLVATSSNNVAVVTGAGSLWSNANELVLGFGSAGNQLVISNGGVVRNTVGYVGNDAASSNNLAVVTDPGSLWTNSSVLYVGFSGASGNQLRVSNGGTVLASNLFIGFSSSAVNNRVIVDGGTLRVTNAAGTGVLDVRRGTNFLNAGLVEADQLLLTNAAGFFEFNGGTLSARNTIVNNGQPFRVGNGVSPAAFMLAGDGSHSFASGLTISANAALTGNGIIGNTAFLPGGTLSPGASIGILRFSSPPLLSGAIFMEISKSGATLSNDQIVVTGTTTYGGSLTVTNIGSTSLTKGDRFQIFAGGSYAGTFGTILLPPLGIGFGWTNKLLVDGSIEVLSTAFTNISAGLPGVESGSVAWGDYDNDGRLDILLTGTTNGSASGGISQVWRNTGSGFTNINAGLPGVDWSSVAWADYDNDGRLDILLTGTTNGFGSGAISQIWRNTGSGFTNINAGLSGVFFGASAWGDYDNDGRLDILLAGVNDSPTSKVLRNIGSGFADINAGLPGVFSGSAAWGDYDNDGRLDILLTGTTNGSLGGISQVWRNTGSSFININAGLTGFNWSSAAWGDYDNDGRLDILLAGTTNGFNSGATSQVWRNTGSGFTNINAGLTGVAFSASSWGDYDNDGRLDILLTGAGTTLALISQVWRNTGSGFADINAGLPGIDFSSAAWGDYDNDGRLDFLLTGTTNVSASEAISQVWRNTHPITNTPPNAPTGLTTTISGSDLTLNWIAATDGQTPAAALTYNIRVGSTPGAGNVVGPMAANIGYRRLPRMGNAQEKLFVRFNASLGAPQYWSVQAVDTSFAGSPFGPEQSFTINPVFTPTNGIPVLGDQNGDGIVSQSELAAVLTNLNGNGILTEADLNVVLSNYFATSPWLYMTNVAGLGGTNVTFALTNSLAGAFSVEYTTNLVDWYFLGPATPRYLFTDTNAPSVPARHYRLRWP